MFNSPCDKNAEYIDQMDCVVSDILGDIAQIQHEKRKFKASKSNNWLTPEALSAKRRRRKLERAWQRIGTAQSYEEYWKHCRATNKLVTDSRKKHFADKVKSSENSRQRRSTIQELLHPPRTPSNPVITTSNGKSFSIILSEFFTKKISNLKSNLTQILVPDEIRQKTFGRHIVQTKTGNNGGSPHRTEVDAWEILATRYHTNSASEKMYRHLCSNHLANLSFREGVFPDRFKKAQITALIKKASWPEPRGPCQLSTNIKPRHHASPRCLNVYFCRGSKITSYCNVQSSLDFNRPTDSTTAQRLPCSKYWTMSTPQRTVNAL